MRNSGNEKLSSEQVEKYSRQLLLDEVGIDGQRRLMRSRVLVVGAGGLGSPAAIYLAAAGVGTVGIVDADRVETWNLHRQILHFPEDVGRRKTRSAGEHLRGLNPDVNVTEHDVFLNQHNAVRIIRPYDVVVNGCDNFPTRYLLNDACVLAEKPLVDAGVLQFQGQASTYLPGRGCLRCLFPAPPPPDAAPSCSAVGVLGALPGHMGTLQAIETLKILLAAGETLTNRFLLFDGLTAAYHSFKWERDATCPVCGDEPRITDPRAEDYETLCGAPVPTEDEPHAPPAHFMALRNDWEVSADQLSTWIRKGRCRVIDVRTTPERRGARLPGSCLIPLDDLREMYDKDTGDRLPDQQDTQMVTYCQVGERSAEAVYLLRQMGYENSFSLRGGILGWSNAGYEVKKGEENS